MSESPADSPVKPPGRDLFDRNNEPGSGSELVSKVIETELAIEQGRKESIESRGGAVITTSGGLVTVLFALAALVTSQDKYVPPSRALQAIVLALGLFVAAAVLGLLTSAIRNYDRVSINDVASTVDHEWETITTDTARKVIAESNLAVLRAAREQTNGKAVLLRWAVICEVGAVVVLALAVAIVLLDAL